MLADQLALHDVELAFCVPGESYLALLDGLYAHRDRLRVVTCRHEAAAANAADAYGKLTGRPGVCMVTRGPGATHAATGVHTAMQDSTPLVLLVGQVPREHRGREAFQEIDYEQMFGRVAKWVCEIDRPGRIPEIVARAFATAVAGRPGPVVLSLPEDVLAAMTDAADAVPVPRVAAAPAAVDLARMRELLVSAERPLAIVGGSGWTPESAADLTAFLSDNGIPAAASFRCQDVVDNRLPIYCGDLGLGVNPALARRVREADLILAIGTRLSETETGGYTFLTPPEPSQTLVHVHQDANELGRVYRPALGIVSSLPEFAVAARALAPVAGQPLRRVERRGARRLRGVARLRTGSRRRCRHGRRARAPARPAARCDRRERRRQLHRSGCTASGSTRATAPSSRRSRVRWATASRPRSRASSCTPSGRSWRSRGTAAS